MLISMDFLFPCYYRIIPLIILLWIYILVLVCLSVSAFLFTKSAFLRPWPLSECVVVFIYLGEMSGTLAGVSVGLHVCTCVHLNRSK